MSWSFIFAIFLSLPVYANLMDPMFRPLTDGPKNSPVKSELLFPWMQNSDSAEMKKWLESQNVKALKSLQQKQDLWKEVRRKVRSTFEGVPNKPLHVENLGNGRTVEVIDDGLGKTMKVEERVNARTTRVFFETPRLDANSQGVLTADVSPDHKWLLVPVSESGSIDEHTLLVFDFQSGQLLWTLKDFSSNWTWYDNNRIVVRKPPQEGSVIIDFKRVVDGLPEALPLDLDISPSHNDIDDRYFFGFDKKNYSTVVGRISSGKTLKVDLPSRRGSILFAHEDTLFLSSRFEGDNIVFWAHFSEENDKVEIREVVNDLTRFVSIVKHETGFLLYGFRGIQAALLNISSNGQVISKVYFPPGVSIDRIEVDQAKTPNLLPVKLESPAADGVPVQLKLPMLQFLDANNNLPLTDFDIFEMAHFDGVNQWTSHSLNAESADGVEIPFLVTHRKGAPMNGSLPAFIDVYGGFGLSIVYANYNPLVKTLFLDHSGFLNGGVIVSPALRGGGELGPSWHWGALRENKIKTFQDLIAVTEKLHALGITSPNRTVISGASNGGYTVAATAALRPDLFEVVVPVNGVLDQVNKGALDSRFEGWSYEYGDISDSIELEKFLRNMSPVHNVGKNGTPPKHIIVVGQSDGRVNPIHSYTMIEVLDRFYPESGSLMISLDRGGHYVDFITFQDVVGFRATSRVWTEILGSLD